MVKKRHIAKSQLIINEKSEQILHCQLEAQGAKSDLKVFTETELQIDPNIKLKADLGYQGIAKIHAKSKLPHKKPKKVKLTVTDVSSSYAL
jgi:hypothetical protein